MTNRNGLTVDVLKQATDILNAQPFIPLSPADLDGTGSACLCAAGILAKAGLLVAGSKDQASHLEFDLVRTKRRELLFSAFASLGWSAALCAEMVKENDATDSPRRKAVIAARLRSLKRNLEARG
jgi:hypothetical protein